jgi:hypothetical protein
MTSRRPTSKAAPVRSRAMVTVAIIAVTGRRSSSACSALGTAARWRWRYSRATPPILPRWRTKVEKLKQRFRLRRVVLVGDRGMITDARTETVLKPAGLDWITLFRAPTVKVLAEAGTVQLSLFDNQGLDLRRELIGAPNRAARAVSKCRDTLQPALREIPNSRHRSVIPSPSIRRQRSEGALSSPPRSALCVRASARSSGAVA